MQAALVIAGFLFGSIPFGYLISRYFYGVDIRKSGSGNIGAANALRTLGKAGGVAVLLLDALKGFLPVLLAKDLHLEPAWVALVASAAVLGHCFSPWLGWRGGKGVATSVGAVIALSWIAGAVCAGGWVAGAAITGFSSVGSILADVLSPLALWFTTHEPAYVAFGAFSALLIIYTHRENIERIRAGRENVIGLFRPGRRTQRVASTESNEGN